MIKGLFNITTSLLLLSVYHGSYGNTGRFFEIVESGVAAHLNLTLCLNGRGPYTCQKYTVYHQTFSIRTTTPDQSYPEAGIRIETPGYTFHNGSGCTPHANGFCLFATSEKATQLISATNTNDTTVNISSCSGGGFFCITLGGAVFNQAYPVRLDTGAGTFNIPESCLSFGNYTVLVEGVMDQFDRPSDIVQADVSLMGSGSEPAITIKDFVFYANTGLSCIPDAPSNGSYGNFGAGMNYVSSAGANNCVASYFNYNTTYNTPTSRYGFTFQNGENLIIGPIQFDGTYYLQAGTPQCNGILAGVPDYLSQALDPAWTGPLVDGFQISINGIIVPIVTPGTDTKYAQIDTGGGLMIIEDNNVGTIATALQSVTEPCDPGISFLTGCQCVTTGKPVIVSATKYNMQYTYTTTTFNNNPQSAVAICPLNQPDNPYVSPNSANLGYELFHNGTVIFDYKNGGIGFTGYQPATFSASQ